MSTIIATARVPRINRLADADTHELTVIRCPAWCTTVHGAGSDPVVFHNGATRAVTTNLDGERHRIALQPSRIDVDGQPGEVTVMLHVDGDTTVEMPAADLHRVLATGAHLAAEVTP